jgi:epoxide hydrolase 4
MTTKAHFVDAYADVNQIRLHYVSSGEGRLILFLHGFPEFWGAWEQLLEVFGRDHRAVAVDLRGYNLSSKPADPKQYNINILVEDLRGLATHLGYSKLVLVAHDWGGGVAWTFANRYPEMIEKLVIINSPHPGVFARELLNNPRQQEASSYMNLLRDPGAEELLSKDNYAFLIDALTAGNSKWRIDEQTRRRYIEAWSQPGALSGGLNYYRASPLYPSEDQAHKLLLQRIMEAPREVFAVNVPTLVIWGELDEQLLTGNLVGLENYVDPLIIKRVADASHWIVHEQPERIHSFINDFINDGLKS